MNGRFYGGHLVEAAHWDGLTNFEVEETQGERDQRLDKWHQFIGDNQVCVCVYMYVCVCVCMLCVCVFMCYYMANTHTCIA